MTCFTLDKLEEGADTIWRSWS